MMSVSAYASVHRVLLVGGKLVNGGDSHTYPHTLSFAQSLEDKVSRH